MSDLCTGVEIIDAQPGHRCVDGLALLPGHLFVLRGTCLNIYSCPDLTQRVPGSGYNLLRNVDVSQLDEDSWNDLVSCEQSASLFISDHRHQCVYSMGFPTDTEVFSKLADVPHSPHGLSLTGDLTLLLTCRNDHMLIEISQTGEFLREIGLPGDIGCPYHAVQLTAAQFVVCYGTTGSDGHHGVSVVDSQRGIMEHSFTQLRYPSHVSIDENNKCIFVSDYQHHRVVRLNFSLELSDGILKTNDCPWRLCLDHVSRKLFIGLEDGSVRILQLS